MSHRDYVQFALTKFCNKLNFKNKKILELGAGGNFFQPFFEQREGKWKGTDITDTDKTNMCNMPHLEESNYDMVYACHSFEHVERPVDALREIHRVLKPGGWVFLATPNPVEHHILRADSDHIFCLNTMQFERLLIYTNFVNISSKLIEEWDEGQIPKEQDYNVISIAQKLPSF